MHHWCDCLTDEPLTWNTSNTDHIHDRKAKLRKDTKVKFTTLLSTTLISRPGKANRKYRNAWNSQLDNETVTSIDFDQDISSLEIVPNSNSNIEESNSQIYNRVRKTMFIYKKKTQDSLAYQWDRL